ncbi:MAG: Tat pathway signal protein [Paracoccaceae bacterium]
MPQFSRRAFLATAAAASTARALPPIALALKAAPTRRVLTLVFDKSIGAMRAIDRLVP